MARAPMVNYCRFGCCFEAANVSPNCASDETYLSLSLSLSVLIYPLRVLHFPSPHVCLFATTNKRFALFILYPRCSIPDVNSVTTIDVLICRALIKQFSKTYFVFIDNKKRREKKYHKALVIFVCLSSLDYHISNQSRFTHLIAMLFDFK